MSAHDKTGVGSGSAEWRTPPALFATLNRRFAFDYDAFASHENALCSKYSTVDGTFVLMGPRSHPGRDVDGGREHPPEGERWPCRASEGTGLAYDWTGARVFMNPPYTRGLIEQCVDKAVRERLRAAIIVALLPAATETRWFQGLVLPLAHIDWLPRRVRYIDPSGADRNSPPQGSVIATFKADLL